jgi:non-heme chloroperoxidase
MMKSHIIAGGGNVPLHVVETGSSAHRPILFIHGFSQCSLAWRRQLDSNLAAERRLVAMDMRGHGLSGKPHAGYAESKLWADDVNAVMQGLELDHPILSGWSYGPLVILDYIRHYGEDEIGGIQFVGGITRLGTEQALSVLAPEFLRLVPEKTLLSRSLDNDDLLPKIRKPVLITHGAQDAVVNPSVVEQHKASMMHGVFRLDRLSR